MKPWLNLVRRRLPSIFSKPIPRRDRALEYSFPSDACALLSGSGIFSRDFGGDWERRVRDYKLRKISVDNRIRVRFVVWLSR